MAFCRYLYATGFSMATDRITEETGGPNEAFCVAQAGQHGVWLAASVAQREPGIGLGVAAGAPDGSGRHRNVGLLVSPGR